MGPSGGGGTLAEKYTQMGNAVGQWGVFVFFFLVF